MASYTSWICFTRLIRDNITFGIRRDVTEEVSQFLFKNSLFDVDFCDKEIIKAAKSGNAHDFIMSFSWWTKTTCCNGSKIITFR